MKCLVSKLSYPDCKSESDIVFDIISAIRQSGLDARCEVRAPGHGPTDRMDIVIFDNERLVLRIVEVKKFRLAAKSMMKGGKIVKKTSLKKVMSQCERYLKFGPVDIVMGTKAARRYIEQKMYLDDEIGIRMV